VYCVSKKIKKTKVSFTTHDNDIAENDRKNNVTVIIFSNFFLFFFVFEISVTQDNKNNKHQ